MRKSKYQRAKDKPIRVKCILLVEEIKEILEYIEKYYVKEDNIYKLINNEYENVKRIINTYNNSKISYTDLGFLIRIYTKSYINNKENYDYNKIYDLYYKKDKFNKKYNKDLNDIINSGSGVMEKITGYIHKTCKDNN